jgi:hypothetical protein
MVVSSSSETIVITDELENHIFVSDDTRVNSVLIARGQLFGREVGRDDGRKTTVLSGIDEIIETTYRESVDKFCTKVIDDKQVTFGIFF